MGVSRIQDSYKVRKVLTEVQNLYKDLQDIVDAEINTYCKPLDDYSREIDEALFGSNGKALPTDLIETYIANLASVLYYVNSGQEIIGLKEDLCKMIRQDVYTKARSACEGTVADKDAAGIVASCTEALAHTAYSHAYKTMKLKAEAGYELLNSLKKILGSRIAEAELSNNRFGGKVNDID